VKSSACAYAIVNRPPPGPSITAKRARIISQKPTQSWQGPVRRVEAHGCRVCFCSCRGFSCFLGVTRNNDFAKINFLNKLFSKITYCRRCWPKNNFLNKLFSKITYGCRWRSQQQGLLLPSSSFTHLSLFMLYLQPKGFHGRTGGWGGGGLSSPTRPIGGSTTDGRPIETVEREL
jgi:hypothetical protein